MTSKITKALCPGSFDPPTVGHTDVIRRAAAMFDEVTVLICVNSAKKGLFTLEEREALMKDAIGDLENVRIENYDGLLMRYAADGDYDVIVKGIRNTKDFTYENELAEVNHGLAEQMCSKPCDTVYILSRPEKAHVSSTIVRELLMYDAPFDGYVDNKELLLEMYKKKTKQH